MSERLRCQIEYSRGQDNYRESLVEIIDQVKDVEGLDLYYFFWQEHSEEFDRHIQLDLILEDETSVEDFKSSIEEILEDLGKDFYWEDDIVGPWWGLNDRENKLLLEARCKNAELAYKTLKSHQKGEIEHRPEQFVNRNYHLSANQMGMTYWDELKFCIKRPIQMLCVKVLPERVYNYLFLRKELANLT